MKSDCSRVVIVVRPGSRTRAITTWLRKLLPAAVLIVATTTRPIPRADVIIDEEDVVSGPLSLADALLRNRR